MNLQKKKRKKKSSAAWAKEFFLAGFCTSGGFFVSIVFLHGDYFQTVSRNIAYRKFICISSFIFPLCGAGCFRRYFAAAGKSSADSDTNLSGVFISYFHCGISDIQTV